MLPIQNLQQFVPNHLQKSNKQNNFNLIDALNGVRVKTQTNFQPRDCRHLTRQCRLIEKVFMSGVRAISNNKKLLMS